jgi:hypothetical protein
MLFAQSPRLKCVTVTDPVSGHHIFNNLQISQSAFSFQFIPIGTEGFACLEARARFFSENAVWLDSVDKLLHTRLVVRARSIETLSRVFVDGIGLPRFISTASGRLLYCVTRRFTTHRVGPSESSGKDPLPNRAVRHREGSRTIRIPPAPNASAIALPARPSCAEYQSAQVSGIRDQITAIRNRKIRT